MCDCCDGSDELNNSNSVDDDEDDASLFNIDCPISCPSLSSYLTKRSPNTHGGADVNASIINSTSSESAGIKLNVSHGKHKHTNLHRLRADHSVVANKRSYIVKMNNGVEVASLDELYVPLFGSVLLFLILAFVCLCCSTKGAYKRVRYVWYIVQIFVMNILRLCGILGADTKQPVDPYEHMV